MEDTVQYLPPVILSRSPTPATPLPYFYLAPRPTPTNLKSPCRRAVATPSSAPPDVPPPAPPAVIHAPHAPPVVPHARPAPTLHHLV